MRKVGSVNISFFIFPNQTGTATSSPADNAASQSLKGFRGGKTKIKNQQTKTFEVNEQPQDIGKINIPNVMLWMLKSAYEQTTIKRVAKELRHLNAHATQANQKK